jgi:putative transposase
VAFYFARELLDIHELEDLIADYIQHYNHERPHQALSEFVPFEVYQGLKKRA